MQVLGLLGVWLKDKQKWGLRIQSVHNPMRKLSSKHTSCLLVLIIAKFEFIVKWSTLTINKTISDIAVSMWCGLQNAF